jgi:hypothetical protein
MQQLQNVETQLRKLKRALTLRPPDALTPTGRTLAQLQTLLAIRPTGVWTLATEILGWRQIWKRAAVGRAGRVGAVAVLKRRDIR